MKIVYGKVSFEVDELYRPINETVLGWLGDMSRHELFPKFYELIFFEGSVINQNSTPEDIDARLFIDDYRKYNLDEIQTFLIDGIALGFIQYKTWVDFYATNIVYSEEILDNLLKENSFNKQSLLIGNKLTIDGDIKVDKKESIQINEHLYLNKETRVREKLLNKYKNGQWVKPIFLKDMK